MTRQTSHEPPKNGHKIFWRSLEEKADASSQAEDAKGSDVTKRTIDAAELGRMRRRSFMTLSGAIGALAGLEGCIRRPVEKILPYTDAPLDVNIGVPLHYASVTAQRGEALGLLVTSHEGRPTKIEGNPQHPASLGSTDLWTQASIMDLYDADRARTPSKGGVAKTWADVEDALEGVAAEALKNGGKGLRVLAQPTLSPSFVRLRDQVKRRFPEARFHAYAPVNDANVRKGTQIAFGQPLVAVGHYDHAKVVLSLDCDFLQTESGSVLASRQFAASRRMESAAGEMSRLYVVEPVMSVTGSNADHRLRLSSSAVGAYLKALAAELATQGIQVGGSLSGTAAAPEGISDQWLKSVAKDLVSRRGESLIVVGSRQPAAVHALAAAVNRALGNAGRTVSYVRAVDELDGDMFADIKSLAADMQSGAVKALVILGGNPAHDAPADLGFGAALGKVATTICVSDRLDETGSLCSLHVPRAHELECWGDALSRSGHYSVQQPLIAPLFDARSDLEVLAALAGEADRSGHTLVRATGMARGIRDELAWDNLIQRGVSESGTAESFGGLSIQDGAVAAALAALPAPSKDFEAVFLPDNKLFDGRYTNNSWLLELPDPVTRITWDNAALIAPSTAKELGIENGDMVRVTVGSNAVELVAWKQPGNASHSIGLPLGWGRKQAGGNAQGAGFDVYPLRTSDAPHFASAKIEKLGKRYPISQTQDHDSMEGRPLAIDATLDEYRAQPDFGQWEAPDMSAKPLWKSVDYSEGHQWSMVIDLNSCTGCNACVIACQSENNIPVVGKDQIARGREMAWLRIDRYYLGEDEDSPEVAFQPIACQHCEEAPCENVCPVNATSHSPEGLNDIAYNRCIGTRYCMNNCPYKVRRFNFLNFNLDVPDTKKMQFNPDVTVRFRGVIEKCSYCVQRIQSAKIGAKRESRVLKDGDVVTACQQACPSQAIYFGDMNDKTSAVSKARATDRNYGLLAEVGTRPRTRFLGKIRNPNPEMKG